MSSFGNDTNNDLSPTTNKLQKSCQLLALYLYVHTMFHHNRQQTWFSHWLRAKITSNIPLKYVSQIIQSLTKSKINQYWLHVFFIYVQDISNYENKQCSQMFPEYTIYIKLLSNIPCQYNINFKCHISLSLCMYCILSAKGQLNRS